MNRQFGRLSLSLIVLALGNAPAFAHHLTGGHTPATFGEGVLSGLGHPVIGLDHLAAVVAVGCLAAAHRAAYTLAVAFVLAMVAGVALHLQDATVPGAEILVARSVIALGSLMLRHREMRAGSALVLFAMVGVIHGYALGESIYGVSRHRSMPICSGSRSFRAQLRLPRRKLRAASRNDRSIFRRCALSAPGLLASGLLCWRSR
jgi:urease accessory protein